MVNCKFNYIEKEEISETEKERLSEIHVQVFQDAVDSKAFRKFNNKLYTLKNNIQAAYNFVSSTNKKLGAKVASIQTEAPGRHKLSVDVLPVSKELQGVLFQKNNNEGIIASEKTIRDLSARMADRIGMNVRFEADKTKDYKGKIDSIQNISDEYGNLGDYTTAVINLAHATLDTPIHEILGHPIIRAIKNRIDSESNIQEEGKPIQLGKIGQGVGLYQNLLKELESGRGKEVLDQVKINYKYKNPQPISFQENPFGIRLDDLIEKGINRGETAQQIAKFINKYFESEDGEFFHFNYNDEFTPEYLGDEAPRPVTTREAVYPLLNSNIVGETITESYSLEEQQEEALVQLLGLMTAEKLDSSKDGKLISLLKRLLKEIKAFVKSLLKEHEVQIDKLPDNLTLGDLSDLLAYSNNKLILPGYEVQYTTPDNSTFKTYEEAKNHVKRLAKDTKDIDLSQVTLELDKGLTDEEKKKVQDNQNQIAELNAELNSDKYKKEKEESLNKLYNELYTLESKPIEFIGQESYLNIEEANKYGFQEFDYVRTQTTDYRGSDHEDILGKDYSGFYIFGYNTDKNKPDRKIVKISKEEAKAIWEKESDNNRRDVDTQQNIYRKKHEIEAIENDYKIIGKISTLESEINRIINGEIVYDENGEVIYVSKTNIEGFINKNKPYEQAKEVIEEWKKVNDIKYNPEEIYSRGQGFYSVIGAYSSQDINLLFQNLLHHIEDNQKAGGEFTISAFTKPIDRNIGHLEGGGGKVKFVIYPKSEDIKWASNTDVYSGSVWDASTKISKDKKSELLGVSYTKYPALENVSTIQPNLASVVDNLSHYHNELGIALNNNFRLEYDENIPYQTKKLIDNLNTILDQKFGKLEKPKINDKNYKYYTIYRKSGNLDSDFGGKYTYNDVISKIDELQRENTGNIYGFNEHDYKEGIQPTQTNETLKESISDVKQRTVKLIDRGFGEFTDLETPQITDISDNGKDERYLENPFKLTYDDSEGRLQIELFKTLKEAEDRKKEVLETIYKNQKNYTSQALINTKIAKLKEVAKKYPLSLIRSEVKPISSSNESPALFDEEDMPFQKINKEEVKSNAVQDAELRNKYFSQGSTNDAVDVLKKIAQSDHVLNKLANHLIKYSEENNVQIELVPVQSFERSESLKLNSDKGIAYYNPKENKIYIAEFGLSLSGQSEYSLVHEILHSISYNQLKGNETAQDFYKLFEYAKSKLEKSHAIADEYEFLVALFTNAKFIKDLQNIPSLSGVKEYKNLFEEIFDYLLKVLGITKTSNLYEQAFSIATNILENERIQNESLNQVPESQEYQEEEDFELSENEEPFLLANEEEGDTGWQEHIRLVEETEEIHNSDEILDSTPELDALINTQVDRLRNIQKELAQNKKGDPIKRQTLSKRMLIVENSIKRLLENKGYYSLLYTQNRTILNGIEVLDNESQEDFKYIQNIIEDSKTLITEIYKVHSELNTEQKALLSDLQVNLGALQNKYNTVNIKVSNKEAEGVGITYQPTSTAKRDIGSLGKWFLSAAEAKDIPELQIISKWLNYAKNKINEQISTLKDTIFRVKQNNPDWREKVKTFFDSKGKFIIQSTSEYYEEEKRINQEKDRVIRDPNSTSTQMALAFQSVRDWYIKNAVYSRSDVGDAKYEKDLQDFLSINEDLRIKNPAQFEAELYLFEQENSPQAYLDYIAEVKLDPNHYVPGVRKRIGYRNLLVVPNSTYDNPEYEKIKDDELYLLIRNTIIQAQSLVPRKMTFDVGNFDKVLNEFTLDMSEQDPFTIKGLLGGLGKNFTEWFTQAKEGSNLTFNAVDSQGNDISFVLAPDVKKFMESKPEDIFEVLTKFYEMAVVYDQNSKILPTLQLYSDKLAERPKIKTNKFGTPLHKPKLLNGKIQRDSNGKIIKEEKPEEIKSGLQNAKDLALFTIKSQIFGETKADEDTTFAFWMDKLINYTRLLGIGLKPFSAINNFIIGKLNNYAWAAKGTDFDDKSLLRAQNVIYGNILKAFNIDKSLTQDAKKLAILLDKYNILGSSLNKFEGDTQNRLTDIMYFLMTSGEYMIHSEGFIAKMMHTPLTRLDGKEGTLWDYIQINDKDEVTYNIKEYGEQNFEEISPNSKLNNWLYQYNEYRKSTQGDYSNPLYVNQYAWGRALMIFRRWLPQAAYQRFGRESEDKNFKGRFLSVKDINVFYKKGSTNSVVPVIKTIATLFGESTYILAANRRAKGISFEEDYKKLGLSEIDIKNMQVNIREMRLAAWMFLIVLALGAANDGDDPELNLAVNTASRLFQDLTFFASPTSALSVIRNPLPIITTMERFNEVKDYTLNYIGGGEDTYQRGIYKDHSKLGVSIVKALPGASALPSTLNVLNQEFSSTSYKFSK